MLRNGNFDGFKIFKKEITKNLRMVEPIFRVNCKVSGWVWKTAASKILIFPFSRHIFSHSIQFILGIFYFDFQCK